jgi:hypothetical protein
MPFEGNKMSTLPDFSVTLSSKELLRKQVADLTKERDEARELVYDCFNQACQIRPHSDPEGVQYDHMCLSSYEWAQAQLLKWEVIKVSECYRYKPPCDHIRELYVAATGEIPRLDRCTKCKALLLPLKEEKDAEAT